MSIHQNQRTHIEKVIQRSLRDKLDSYTPETKHMPFHHKLIGKDRMALYSFIQSLNTTFGTSIFEPAAEVLANPHFKLVQKQYVVGKNISQKAQLEIQSIIDELSNGKDTNKAEEIERIRKVCQIGEIAKTKPVKADLFLEAWDGTVHLFDLKTVKPNKSNFKDFNK